jgi:hypothetical protein
MMKNTNACLYLLDQLLLLLAYIFKLTGNSREAYPSTHRVQQVDVQVYQLKALESTM